MNLLKGKLIVIEGTDGSGKETQSLGVRKRLQDEGIACGYFSFPRYETPTGGIVKRYLGKPPFTQEFGPANEVPARIASTWYALDRLAAVPEINILLSRGIPVICNRYVESNMAHQGGKIKEVKNRAALIKWLDELEHDFLKIPRANLVVFLYMPHQVASELREERANSGGEVVRLDGHESDSEHMMNAERAYLELAEMYGWTKVNCAPDGTRASLKSIDDIGNEVYGIVKRALQNT